MTLIQRTAINKIIPLLVFVSQVLLHFPSFGQQLAFSKTKISLSEKPGYFLLDVIDKRKVKKNGVILTDQGKQSVEFATSTERALYEFWKYSINSSSPDPIPLVAGIQELTLNEKTLSPTVVAGEISINILFEWQRDETIVPLTGYKVKTSYTRPANTPYNHSSMLQRMLSDALIHFDKWMLTNDNKNPALVRSVRLKFKEPDNSHSSDTVFYNPNAPLKWSDFQANSSNRTNRYAAGVFTSMAYEGSSKANGKFLDVELTIKTYMVKEMSWVKPYALNDYGLRHEQIHFDITRIMVEKFKERVRNLELTVDDYDSLIQYQFLEAYRAMHNEQEKYDNETNHGINTAVQARWDRQTSDQIKDIYAKQSPAN